MIWGKLPGYDWWPGVVLSYSDNTNGMKKEVEDLSDDETESNNGVRVWVKWYGDNQLSQVLQCVYVCVCVCVCVSMCQLDPLLFSLIINA